MKDFYFAADLLALLRNDKYYGSQSNLAVALRKFGLADLGKTDNFEKMLHTLVVHMMDLRGESESFLEGTFIIPEKVVLLLKEQRLPAPSALLPAGATKRSGPEKLEAAQFEQLFDTVCRNCGTVTDPLANAYRTPIGRLIFRTFLETRLTLGINTTARYVLEHLTNFDTDQIIASVSEDAVFWKTADAKEKITSIQTIDKFVLNFNRELKTLL